MKNELIRADRFSFTSSAQALMHMPRRTPRSNKGDYGRVLCICGSYGMAGAAYLCAKAAYRSGAGLVEIFTHESNRIILQSALPEAIVSTYDESYKCDRLLPSLCRADAVVAGCGLGVTPLSREILSDLLHSIDKSKSTAVLDADALNLISKNPSLLKYAKDTVVTPHPAEMSRLTGKSVEEILASHTDICRAFAKDNSLICLLKDHRTAVSDGERIYLNTTGNSGMATGGSGDVLAGILGGIFAQRKNSPADLFKLTCLCAYLHGRCGDIAAKTLGEHSLMASDLIDFLPTAIKN